MCTASAVTSSPPACSRWAGQLAGVDRLARRHCIIQVIANLLAKPSQQAAVPYPVYLPLAFGVFGANIPAVIRG